MFLTLRRGIPRYPSAPLYYLRRIIYLHPRAPGAIGHMNYDNSEGRPSQGVRPRDRRCKTVYKS